MNILRLGRLFAAAALSAAAPLSAYAFCGFYAGKADANLFNEASQVVMVRDGKRTVLSMLNDYKGPLSEFALVVPTQTVLQKGQVRVADKLTFERLDAYSSPRLAQYDDSDPCKVNFLWGDDKDLRSSGASTALPMSRPALRDENQMTRDRALGVTVETQYTLEEYDIVSLSATQSDGLETWLVQNGYRIPRGASEALRPYINQGMKFFVAKVNLQEQLKTGYTTLRPLQFAFESEKFMLPMRLGMLNAPPDKPQDLIVYLLTREGRVESSNYRTVKLPTDKHLPYFIKPKFQDFYKAMFDTSALTEDHRVVFTEYFWDMAWCDPCAANPLSPQELRNAGVFWVDGDAGNNFQGMSGSSPPGSATRRPMPAATGAQPVMLTRLHVRYTPKTFPEDLMFTQTRDRQNWQTRYVVQNPYQGSVEQCSARVGQMDCEAMCRPRVEQLARDPNASSPIYRNKDRSELLHDCLAACVASKQAGIEAATRYYQRDLPARIESEKKTLAQLTGWNMADIDALPQARKFQRAQTEPSAPKEHPITWWERLFKSSQANP